jgi:hypothetical protein
MKGMRQLHGAWRYLPYLDLFFAVLITLLFLIFNHILHSSGTSLGFPIRESLPERAVWGSWDSPSLSESLCVGHNLREKGNDQEKSKQPK